jgi:hypothetical protein
MFGETKENYAAKKKSTKQLIKDLIVANKEQGLVIDYTNIINGIRKKFGNSAEVREVIALLKNA